MMVCMCVLIIIIIIIFILSARGNYLTDVARISASQFLFKKSGFQIHSFIHSFIQNVDLRVTCHISLTVL